MTSANTLGPHDDEYDIDAAEFRRMRPGLDFLIGIVIGIALLPVIFLLAMIWILI